VLTVSKSLDPYNLNLIELNTYLNNFKVNTNFPMNLIASFAVAASLAEMPETISTYLEMTDKICQPLNPFKDPSIYNYKDLHGLSHLFTGPSVDKTKVLIFF